MKTLIKYSTWENNNTSKDNEFEVFGSLEQEIQKLKQRIDIKSIQIITIETRYQQSFSEFVRKNADAKRGVDKSKLFDDTAFTDWSL